MNIWKGTLLFYADEDLFFLWLVKGIPKKKKKNEEKNVSLASHH